MSFIQLTIASIASLLSYALAKSLALYQDVGLTQINYTTSVLSFLDNNKIDLSITQIFWYGAIQSLLILIIINKLLKKKYSIQVFNVNFYNKNKLMFILLLLPVINSQYKAFLNGYYTMGQLAIYSLLGYVISIITKRLFVKESKMTFSQLIILIVAILGFLLSKVDNKFHVQLSIVCLGLSFLTAFSDNSKYYASKIRHGIEGGIVDCLLYVFIAILGFFFTNNFDIKYLFSWQVFIVMIPCVLQHIYTILGNKSSNHFIYIILNNFLKLFWNFLIDYIIFGKFITTKEMIGIIIIAFAIIINSYIQKK